MYARELLVVLVESLKKFLNDHLEEIIEIITTNRTDT